MAVPSEELFPANRRRQALKHAVPSEELFPANRRRQTLKHDLTPIIIWLSNNSGLLGRMSNYGCGMESLECSGPFLSGGLVLPSHSLRPTWVRREHRAE